MSSCNEEKHVHFSIELLPQEQDPDASTKKRLEQRTLDLLHRATATADLMEAEELRFKSSLCLFLSRSEPKSLQKVVATYLNDLSNADWPEEAKVPSTLAPEVRELYPDTLALDTDMHKDPSKLFDLLWQQWMQLAAALDPTPDARPDCQENPAPANTPARKLSLRRAVSVKTEAQVPQQNSAEDKPPVVLEQTCHSIGSTAYQAQEMPCPDADARGGKMNDRPSSHMHLDLSQLSKAATASHASRACKSDRTGASLSQRLADPSTFSSGLLLPLPQDARQAPFLPSARRLPTAAHLLTPRQFQLLQFQVLHLILLALSPTCP